MSMSEWKERGREEAESIQAETEAYPEDWGDTLNFLASVRDEQAASGSPEIVGMSVYLDGFLSRWD